jgi:DnaJ-class molecular chaperone
VSTLTERILNNVRPEIREEVDYAIQLAWASCQICEGTGRATWLDDCQECEGARHDLEP